MNVDLLGGGLTTRGEGVPREPPDFTGCRDPSLTAGYYPVLPGTIIKYRTILRYIEHFYTFGRIFSYLLICIC